MARRLLLLILIPVSIGAAWAEPAVPSTPAGRALAAWLQAFNSGDRARIDGFVKLFSPQPGMAALTSAQFRGQSGGVTLVAVTRSERNRIDFRLEEKAQPTVLLGKIEVGAAPSAAIEKFTLRPVPQGAVLEDLKLDTALRTQVISDVLTNLDQFYISSETSKKMDESLRAHASNGDYNHITGGEEFASRLTADLVAVSHDKHLVVFYNAYKLPADPPPQNYDQVTEDRKAMARDCGIRKVDILPNNVGYMKFDFFADPLACGKTAAAAITFLANTDAVIFDVRENSGGDPRMVTLVCSYFFDQPVHLEDFYDRASHKVGEDWTMRFVPGLRLGRKPAYVLTSGRTFSGAEEFAYDLKNLKRVTVVGERTAGGSHPVGPHKAGDHFVVYVPDARPVSPVTGTDWEGTGVSPDVPVKADDALEAAERLAAEKIQQDARPNTNTARAN
jgi:peptidase S41-like protein